MTPVRHRDPDVRVIGQTIPDDFAQVLRDMRAHRDMRLDPLLHLAHLNGWTYVALGNVLGVSRQAVEQRVLKAGSYRSADLPDVPLPPRHPAPLPAGRKGLTLDPETVEHLNRMRQLAATVNGSTPEDDPRRTVSEEYTRLLHRLVEQGVSMYHIAQQLDVDLNTIAFRLARHGYRPLPPSLARRGQEYRRRQTDWVASARRREARRRGEAAS